MTPQELAQSGKPGLISARKTLLDRYNAASDPAEKQQISDAVDVVNDLITAADLDDLLMAAGPVDAAADAMANAIGTARMQIFGQALQTVVDTLAKFEVPKVKAPAVGPAPKPTATVPPPAAPPVQPAAAAPPPAAPPVQPANKGNADGPLSAAKSNSNLGQLSIRYETGGRGPGTISSGSGDAGGVSYGSYQMTSRGGGTVGRFVADPAFPFKDRFAGLAPGSPEFTAAWRERWQQNTGRTFTQPNTTSSSELTTIPW